MLKLSRTTHNISRRTVLLSPLSTIHHAMPAHRSHTPTTARHTPTTARHLSATALVRATDLSERTFQSLPISAASKKAITHEFMTNVQAITLEEALTGRHMLVQAKTGTGKTLAFLLPAIERIVKIPNVERQDRVSCLIMAPTRELAQQILEEAEPIAKQHNLKVVCAFGGVNIVPQKARITGGCDILVATPGRLNDLLENHAIKSSFSSLRFYVLDEVDRMLDQGFKKELAKINEYLPNPIEVPRQNLFFSATMDNNVRTFMDTTLGPTNYSFVKTVSEDEELTHQRVSQTHIITPFENHLPTVVRLLEEDREQNPGSSKVIVFFNTARAVDVSTATVNQFNESKKLDPVLQIQSRLTQPARTRVSKEFRDAAQAVLFSSDVTARGVDFPGVTLVIQVGLPQNGEQYIHRLGRTARAGKDGRGIIILDQIEKNFLRIPALKDITISPAPPSSSTNYQIDIKNIMAALPDKTKTRAYLAWMGYYNTSSRITKWNATELVAQGEQWVRSTLGWSEQLPPPVEKKVVGKMGLKGIRGLNTVNVSPYDSAPPRQRNAPAIASKIPA